MTPRNRQFLLTGALLLSLASAVPSEARAGDWFGLRWRRAVVAQSSVSQPVAAPTLNELPAAPNVGYALPPSRPFPWGSFGAQPRPHNVYHESYLGTYRDWGYRPGL